MANRLQTDTAMSVSSLPVEILEDILQDMISEYKKRTKLKVLPPWYLASLLRVCKLWNMVYESYLYRSISIGRLFSHDTLRIRGNSDGRQIEIAGKLIRTFSANPRLAALVEEFELMAEGVQAPKWSRTAARLIDLCPNLQHVKLEGLGPEMTMSLKKRSLVSFRIDAKRHSGYSSFPIYELMRQWPRLQTIRIDGVYNLWLRTRGGSFSPTSLASSALNCCSELREINLTGGISDQYRPQSSSSHVQWCCKACDLRGCVRRCSFNWMPESMVTDPPVRQTAFQGLLFASPSAIGSFV